MQNLKNIIDEIVPDKEATFFNTEESLDLYETCIWVMEEFIRNNPKIITEADFEDIFNDNMDELMASHFTDDIFYNEESRKFERSGQSGMLPRSFVHFILEPFYKVVSASIS